MDELYYSPIEVTTANIDQGIAKSSPFPFHNLHLVAKRILTLNLYIGFPLA